MLYQLSYSRVNQAENVDEGAGWCQDTGPAFVIFPDRIPNLPRNMPSMRISPTLCSLGFVLCAALAPSDARAQSLIDPVLAPGEFRLSGGGAMLSWRDRFGIDGEREPVATDLTRESAADLIPGLSGLTTALDALLDDSSPLRLGASSAVVSHNEVRVPIRLDVGVLDRLTVGVTVPVVRSTLETDLRIASAADAGVGENPAISEGSAVTGFLDLLTTRSGEASALAAQRCGLDPQSPECAAATLLADDLGAGALTLEEAYQASALFPAQGTAAGDALVAWAAALDASLAAEGLSPLGGTPPLASAVLDEAGLQSVVTNPLGPFGAAPLESFGGLWGLGDVEVRAAVRLAEGARFDSTGTAEMLWSVAAVGTVRLPTGAADSTGVFLDRGRDDGQLDLEAGVFGSLAMGRLGLAARAFYTRQQPGSVDRRIAPYGQVISGRGDVATLDWDPGDGFRLEIEPALRVAPALSVAASYLYVSRGSDTYTQATDPTGLLPTRPASQYYPDASVLDTGTEFSLQGLGGSITYRSRGLPETANGGFEVFLRMRQAIAGSGGRVPAGVRGEFGLRLVRRLWGSY